MSTPPPAPPAGDDPAAPAGVVVVGGGLAGLTCALDLAEIGLPTTLVEQRPFVGGKTFSFHDARSGQELDNGQHVYLRCCTAYIDLLERLGLTPLVRIQPRLRLPVIDPATGRRSDIASSPAWLPPPLNLSHSILRFAHLSLGEKLRLGRAVLPMLRLPPKARRRLDDQTFADWLRAHGQSRRVIARFWDLIVLPTCNDASDDVSAAQAIMVFQTGLLQDAHGADIGLARVGLSHIAEALLARLRARGGRVRLGRAVRSISSDGERVTGVEFANGEAIPAQALVLALPPNRARQVLPEAWRARPGLAPLAQFDYAPIVNVHLHWDRPLLDEDFVAVLDPDVQYVFNRSRTQGLNGDGEWLDVSLSGAHAQAGQPRAAIAGAAIAGLRRAFPAARQAQVREWRVVKEMEATFRAAPGSAARRPGPATEIGNLTLAGAWTDTGWPATMESAVRSGHSAAAACRAGLAP